MNDTDAMEKGVRILHEMHGPERAEEARRRWREISPDLERYIVEFVSGEIWGRTGLDRRTKTLITIAVLAVQGRSLALEHNLRKAPNNGVTQDEIVETFLHLAAYAGFPVCWEGLHAAQKVFQDNTEREKADER